MKKIFLIFLISLLINSPSHSLDSVCKLTGFSCSKVNYENLITKKGFYYEKFKNKKYLGYVFGVKSGFIKNGKEDGNWEIYYKSGELQKKVNYKNGVMEGNHEEYYRNGNISSKSTYKNGLKHGIYNEYKSDGQLRFWTEYKNGKRDGEYEHYSKGKLWIKGNYLNDKRNGIWSYTNKLGKVTTKTWDLGRIKFGYIKKLDGTKGLIKNYVKEGNWEDKNMVVLVRESIKIIKEKDFG